MENKIIYNGNLLFGHDGEMYIQDKNGTEHDVSAELSEKLGFEYLGQSKKVKLIIEGTDILKFKKGIKKPIKFSHSPPMMII